MKVFFLSVLFLSLYISLSAQQRQYSTTNEQAIKYYALASNVPVGTIVKITYPSTNKSVYAKVLGELPDMKESAGLALRISDAAAYELGSADSKFSVSVKY